MARALGQWQRVEEPGAIRHDLAPELCGVGDQPATLRSARVRAWAASKGKTSGAINSFTWARQSSRSRRAFGDTGMTYAAIPILRNQPGLQGWAEKAADLGYDPTFAPVSEKSSAHIGFAMTEKQGGPICGRTRPPPCPPGRPVVPTVSRICSAGTNGSSRCR